MLIGHGLSDYFVVIGSLIITINLLKKKPEKLLFFLPTLLTIDFFIPFISDLTPGRLLPLIIGVWLVNTGKWKIGSSRQGWLEACLWVIIVSTVFSIFKDDSGLRPMIRSLSYINLLVLFVFAYRYVKDSLGITYFFRGLALAGVVHSGYSTYQIIAHYLGLPYRGIVRSASVVGNAALSNGAFRINGLADEPKRLGLILIAASIAMLLLAVNESILTIKIWRIFGSIYIFIISLFTYSSSYFVSLALWIPAVLLLSKRSYKYVTGLIVFLLISIILLPSSGRFYLQTQLELLNSRQEEVSRGLESQQVYRQEFYAQDYLEKRPETILTGVGIGRYNYVFAKHYGRNAGLNENGGLNPLNSELLQIIYDFGIAGLALFYYQILLLVINLRSKGLVGFVIAAILLYEVIQSFFVQTLPIMMLTGGVAAGMLDYIKTCHRYLQK